jgi:uncharacterized protein DUF903
MKRIFFLLFLGLIALTGCAHNYVMKLSNGLQVTTASKPKLKGAYYYYKDANGKVVTVAATRVREIEPASMAAEEKPRFIPSAQ